MLYCIEGGKEVKKLKEEHWAKLNIFSCKADYTDSHPKLSALKILADLYLEANSFIGGNNRSRKIHHSYLDHPNLMGNLQTEA